MHELRALLPYASPAQARYVAAIQKHGSQKKAADVLKVNQRTVQRAIEALKKKAAQRGYSPDHDMTHPVPDGFRAKGVSSFYGPDGELAGQWVKSEIDRAQEDARIQEAIAAACETLPREKPKAAPKRAHADLLNLYAVTDYHLGSYSWREETGADWDTDIAEDLLVKWFSTAVTSSPDASVGVLALLGDFLHWDGMEAVTPEHKNILDADTRFEKLVRVAIRVIRRVVRMLLRKHERVHLIFAEGNHDLASSAWLREMFAAMYEDEPRITVDRSPDPYYAYEFGETSLFFHHGHKRNTANVADVFAAKFRPVFGRTKHSYAHLGHKHQAEVKETNLMLVEQHRTLAARDAYASRGGWISGRGASVITYHRAHGEVGRVVIGPEMCA